MTGPLQYVMIFCTALVGAQILVGLLVLLKVWLDNRAGAEWRSKYEAPEPSPQGPRPQRPHFSEVGSRRRGTR